jgi:hypothetical protein
LVAELCFFLWPYVHRLRGGSDVPPPRWTETDLRVLPDDEDNAWHLIGHSHELPPFHFYASLLDEDTIPSHLIDSADAALKQPRVAELLHRAKAVRAKPTLASPDGLDEYLGEDILRLSEWHYWLVLSAKRKLEREPSTAADELAHQIPMWIQCANLARRGITYFACAVQARRDLELSLELAKVLVDRDARSRLAASIREAPALSPENAFIAEYILAYRGLKSYRATGKRTFLRRTDLKGTLASIDQTFLAALAGDECEDRHLTQWGYNWGGKTFAYILTASVCMCSPRLHAVSEQVSKLRADVLRALSNPPDYPVHLTPPASAAPPNL